MRARWSLHLFVLIGFLRGQPINLHVQPAHQTSRRNQNAPFAERQKLAPLPCPIQLES
jgi:hypothetical protein